MRIEVYDRTNRKRLLGTLIRPAERNDYYRFVCIPKPLAVMDFQLADVIELETYSVTFEFAMNGWDPVFVTDAPLEHLGMIERFCFPGETEAQSARRRHGY